MFKTIVHHEGAGALASAGIKGQQSSSAVKPREVDAGPVRSVIKLGVDVHAKLHVVVAQHDHALGVSGLWECMGELEPVVKPLGR